jgi:hypothetical protein
MRLTMRRAFGPLTALVIGCGGDSTGPGNVGDGEFTFKVTGAFDQTVTGNAYWATGASAEGGFAISLSTGQRGTIIGRESPAAPAVGTYQFGSTDAAATPPDQFIVIAILGSGISFCGSQSGSMQITSTGAHIRGTFTTNVSCFDQSSNSIKDAVITGEFDAVEAPQQ